MRFATRLIHSEGDGCAATGAVNVPIYNSSTYAQSDLEQPARYDYARSGNPTRAALEQAIADLEGGCRGFAFASGMAALSTVLSLFSAGDHLVVGEDVYGGTYRVLTRVFQRFGLQSTFADASKTDNLVAAIRRETRALLLETPSNPFLKITDLAVAAELAKQHNLLTIVDNTFMSPYLQRPLELGSDIVVHSATKFLGGHSDVVAGLAVAKDPAVADEIGFLQNAIGGVLGPQDSWLVLRGIKTLQVRLEREQASARAIVEWLRSRPEVTQVYYPGLASHRGSEIHARQASGPGAVLSFRLASEDMGRRFCRAIQVPALAVSLGGVESILSVPARMSHASLPEQRKAEVGIDDTLFRLSVGLEDPLDLIADLEQALDSGRAANSQ